MRRLVVAAVIALSAQSASAADMRDLPILRGSFTERPVVQRPLWQGFYAGATAGYSGMNADFTRTVQPLTERILRSRVLNDVVPQWELLGTKHTTSSNYGGFVGYNWQWDDAVVGVEAGYTRFNDLQTSTREEMGRRITNPTGSAPPTGSDAIYDAFLIGEASARVKDLITIRARGGYSMGFFMPYAFGGLAVGFADMSRSATLFEVRYFRTVDSTTGAVTTTRVGSSVDTESERKKNLVSYGFNVGGGVDMMLAGNVFVRAEYEYTQLPLAQNTVLQMHTGRVGAGIKF